MDNEIITYIDDLLIQVDIKTQMFVQFLNFHETLRKPKLKAALDKTYFFSAAVNFLGHEITENIIGPLSNKTGTIQQMKRSESKKNLWNFLLGAVNCYYPEHFPNLQVFLAPLYTLSHEHVSFHWNKGPEIVFLQVKQTVTQNCVLTLPSTKILFYYGWFFCYRSRHCFYPSGWQRTNASYSLYLTYFHTMWTKSSRDL